MRLPVLIDDGDGGRGDKAKKVILLRVGNDGTGNVSSNGLGHNSSLIQAIEPSLHALLFDSDRQRRTEHVYRCRDSPPL